MIDAEGQRMGGLSAAGWPHWVLFGTAFALAAALPGPAQGALLARGVTRGPGAAAAFAVGLVAGNALWLGAALAGAGALARSWAPLFTAIRWLGAAYLLWVAVRLWREPPAPPASPPSSHAGALGGLVLSLGNPKAMIFFGAILPALLDPARLTLRQAAGVMALGIAIDSAVQFAYVAVAARAARAVRAPAVGRLVRRAAAGVSAACSAVVAIRG